jgi:RimJ/RimL family protein N-acetyltransferase
MHSVFDGIVRLRASTPGDMAMIVAGRDDEYVRWLGAGTAAPTPTACVETGSEVIGWVDYDTDPAHHWLRQGEVNLGYSIIPEQRGKGFATRAVKLLLHRLALEHHFHTATVLIDPHNSTSLGVAMRAGFESRGILDGQMYFSRALPPLVYADGVVTIRRQDPHLDLTNHLGAVDDEQIDWLWLPGHREAWEAMSPTAQEEHQRRHLQSSHDTFGSGPNWRFSVDSPEERYVAYADCDLANDHVPAGEANISYASHPRHRGKGYVARAVRLVAHFLSDHTGARQAHLVIDANNLASLRVANAVGAVEHERWRAADGSSKVRFLIDLPLQGFEVRPGRF